MSWQLGGKMMQEDGLARWVWMLCAPQRRGAEDRDGLTDPARD